MQEPPVHHQEVSSGRPSTRRSQSAPKMTNTFCNSLPWLLFHMPPCNAHTRAFRKASICFLAGQDSFCWSTGPLIGLSSSKEVKKMAITMIILPLMYSHPSIKDTLPQRSVIASQSQLCLDNPSWKCTKCQTMSRTARDCPQRAVWRKENFLWWS